MSGAKSWDLNFRTYALWTPHKEHTKSAIRKNHLAPCRFKCWTNQISIGISQPLAQLQCRYNVEIPRVSLNVAGAKWDFRTDSVKQKWKKICSHTLVASLSEVLWVRTVLFVGKCEFRFRRFKKGSRALATRAKAHLFKLDQNRQSPDWTAQRSNHWAKTTNLTYQSVNHCVYKV